MKNPFLPIAILLALVTFSPAADPTDPQVDPDTQWVKMFEVMYDLPKHPKDTQLEQLKSLIDQGADVNQAIGFDRMLREGERWADLRGTTWPLDVAVQRSQVDMVELLLAKGAKFHGGELAKAALAANHDESLAMMTALLRSGADVNSPHEYGITALFGAIIRGNKNSVELLLAQPGIKIDQPNEDGDTALMAAAENGHTEIVEMLLKAGANVKVTGVGGETAITRAQKALAKQQAIVAKQQAMIAKLQSARK